MTSKIPSGAIGSHGFEKVNFEIFVRNWSSPERAFVIREGQSEEFRKHNNSTSELCMYVILQNNIGIYTPIESKIRICYKRVEIF